MSSHLVMQNIEALSSPGGTTLMLLQPIIYPLFQAYYL